MASIITLDGAMGATNEYGEQLPSPSIFGWGDAAQTFVGWGIVAFALGTAAFRLKDALASGFHRGRQYRPTREDMQGWFGKRRRRR